MKRRDVIAEEFRARKFHERMEEYRQMRESANRITPDERRRNGAKAGLTNRLKNVPITLPSITPRRNENA